MTLEWHSKLWHHWHKWLMIVICNHNLFMFIVYATAGNNPTKIFLDWFTKELQITWQQHLNGHFPFFKCNTQHVLHDHQYVLLNTSEIFVIRGPGWGKILAWLYYIWVCWIFTVLIKILFVVLLKHYYFWRTKCPALHVCTLCTYGTHLCYEDSGFWVITIGKLVIFH